jgi:hypothetical protein
MEFSVRVMMDLRVVVLEQVAVKITPSLIAIHLEELITKIDHVKLKFVPCKIN